MVTIEYDKKADAMYIWFKKTTYDISEELAENVVIDLDKSGHIIGIEVLDVSKKLGKEKMTSILQTENVVTTT